MADDVLNFGFCRYNTTNTDTLQSSVLKARILQVVSPHKLCVYLSYSYDSLVESNVTYPVSDFPES